jgi:hypothetical protein
MGKGLAKLYAAFGTRSLVAMKAADILPWFAGVTAKPVGGGRRGRRQGHSRIASREA